MSPFPHSNIVDPIERQSERRPDSIAIEDAGDLKLSGGDLALEEQIAKLWAAELNLAAVGLDDDFFAIGGDSLSGVRVFLAVEKAFGKPLPARALVTITTVRELARRHCQRKLA